MWGAWERQNGWEREERRGGRRGGWNRKDWEGTRACPLHNLGKGQRRWQGERRMEGSASHWVGKLIPPPLFNHFWISVIMRVPELRHRVMEDSRGRGGRVTVRPSCTMLTGEKGVLMSGPSCGLWRVVIWMDSIVIEVTELGKVRGDARRRPFSLRLFFPLPLPLPLRPLPPHQSIRRMPRINVYCSSHTIELFSPRRFAPWPPPLMSSLHPQGRRMIAGKVGGRPRVGKMEDSESSKRRM